MPREARSPKYIATLALVSASILISGSLLKPDKQPREQPLLSDTEMTTRLQRLTQRQSLNDMADFFAQAASDAQASVVLLSESGRSGIIWGPDLVATAHGQGRFVDHETFRTADGRVVSAQATVAAPNLPVAAVQLSEEVTLPMATSVPVEFLRPGRWVFALWRRETREHAFAPGNYLGTQEIRCWDDSYQEVVSTLSLSDAMAGGGLLDLDGNLLGLIVLCDGRPAILSNESVRTALDMGVSFHGRMATRYGMEVGNLEATEQAHYARKEGVVVRETWRDYRADQAGLLPGDVIIGLEDKPVRTIDDLEVLILPLAVEIFELRVVRGRRTVGVKLRARPPNPHDADHTHAGLELSAPSEGFAIGTVASGSPAAEAGVLPGDRLLKIDHEDPRNLNAVRQALAESRDKPLHVVLERGDRRWGVFLM